MVSTTLYKQSEVTNVSDIESHIFGKIYLTAKSIAHAYMHIQSQSIV